MELINQLCKKIEKHPSNINSLNDAIKIALEDPRPEYFKPIIKLIHSLSSTPSLQKFIQSKQKIIFLTILQKCINEVNQQYNLLLSQVFERSNIKKIMIEAFIEALQNSQISQVNWPLNILIQVFDQISQMNQSGSIKYLSLSSNFIVNLPHYKQLEITEHLQVPFKKNFQRLLISTISNSEINRDELRELYHNFGEKIFSKLQNPLILSNHCLQKFQNDSQLQIQVLSCIFLLVGKYGLQLEYFYPKLEKLIKTRKNGYSIYELPNSRRFFKLLEAALRSSRVPYKTISVFAHILIKQIIQEESKFSFWCLSFIFNLTKKHRKLLEELPLIPQLKALRHHYNPKVRALVQELSKNLNKVDYLEIDQFTNLGFQAICESKMKSLINSLDNQQLQFKIPAFDDPI